MGRRGEHMHAGVRSRSKARARALEEHLVRLPTEGEGRLLLAGGFPCSKGAELRGRRAGHVPEGGRSSGVIEIETRARLDRAPGGWGGAVPGTYASPRPKR